MNMKALAQDTGLNVKTIRFLETMGLITDPLQEEQLYFMQWLAVIWKTEDFMRLQIANLSMPRRARLLFGSGYTKPERYMIHRILGHFSDREDGGTMPLHIKNLVTEAMCYYRLPETARHDLTVKAYKLRKRICNMRYSNPDLVAIGKSLTQLRKPSTTKTTKAQSARQRQIGQNEIFGYN